MPRPTPQQQAAIGARGDVLVMAGAGSGKTTTLVARILDRVLDDASRIPLDRLLVVTFNEAAAAEMRHRLRAALQARALAAPDDLWIAEQFALLDTAAVSTLHAFCLQIVREHFHDLGLDPRFTVLDEAQTSILRAEALADVLRAHYDGTALRNPLVRPFLERHARPEDRSLRELVLRVHDYARSLPSAAGWIEQQRDAYSRPEPVAWRERLSLGTAAWARDWLGHTRRIATALPENLPAAQAVQILERLTVVDSALVPEALWELERTGSRERFPRGTIGRFRKPLERLFAEASTLRELLVPGSPSAPDPLLEDWNWARPDVLALLELVEQFDLAFTSARRAAAGLDFADLEQLALALLWDPAHETPSPLAVEWRRRFDLVFVDEYQDINGAQDRIVDCLGREGSAANRFFVGDVKQSIYRFRRADPRIFRRYAECWRSDPQRAALPLQENFRSHEAILAFVNALFRILMRPAVGGVDYGPDAELVYGAPESRPALREGASGRVELLLLLRDAAPDVGEGDERPAEGSEGAQTAEDEAPSEATEATMVATRLRTLHGAGTTVWDPTLAAHRPLTWRDIAILHPSPRPVAEEWAHEFAAAGIPFEARRAGFFEAIEVSDLVNLIRLLDNPRQDLPLLAVLRSPIVGLTLNELAALRMVLPRRGARLWEALVCLVRNPPPGQAAPEPPPSSDASGAEPRPATGAAPDPDSQRQTTTSARLKAHWFLDRFDTWRRLARESSLATALEAVLAATSYEAWLGAQPRARARLANVRQLLALSRQFDRFQRHGLFRFLQFLDARQEAGDRAESAPAAEGDSVRFLSMHQAKGLEFPVVVVAGLGRRFNTRDLLQDWLLDEEYGLCPPVVPPGRRRGYASLPRVLAGHRQRTEFLGEQIRLLYVACTRAVDRLLLAGSTRTTTLRRWAEAPADPSTRDLLQALCGLDWLGPLLPALTGLDHWAEADSGSGRLLDWRLVRPGAASPTPHDPSQGPSGNVASAHPGQDAQTRSALETLRETLDWRYAWSTATRTDAKTAVTTLRRQWQVDDMASTSAAPNRHAHSTSAVDRGTLHHLFCELVHLPETVSLDRLAAEAQRLVAEGWLKRDEADSLDLPGLATFWSSSLADAIRSHASHVHRELPFTVRLRRQDANLLGAPSPDQDASTTTPQPHGDDDFQVVQGVIDLAVLKPDEIWIVDYKTDQVSAQDTPAKATAYGAQLRLYAHALESIYRRPVTRLWLYFLTPRSLVHVPLHNGRTRSR